MAKISVIIPCYNQGRYLFETLQSVHTQSYTDWECIIVNDGSQDESEAVALQWCEKDPRFKYVKQENAGASKAKNSGLALAEGEFIQFLDADDLIEPEKFRVQVDIFSLNETYDLVYSPVRYFTGTDIRSHYLHFNLNNESWQPKISGAKEVVFEELIQQNIFAIHCPLVRKQTITKTGVFNETLTTHEDYDYWIRMSMNSTFFHFDATPGTFALVRTHPASVSNDRERMNIDYYLVKIKLANFLVANKIKLASDIHCQTRFIKKQITCFYLDNKISFDSYKSILSISEKRRLQFLSIIPQRLRFHFMMMDRYEMTRIFSRIFARKQRTANLSIKN